MSGKKSPYLSFPVGGAANPYDQRTNPRSNRRTGSRSPRAPSGGRVLVPKALIARLERTETIAQQLQSENSHLAQKLNETELETRLTLDQLAVTENSLREKERLLGEMTSEAREAKEQLLAVQRDVELLCQTPVELLARAMHDSMDTEVDNTLRSILRSLASTEMYQPAFTRLKERSAELHPRLQSFLSTYTSPSQVTEGSAMTLPSQPCSPQPSPSGAGGAEYDPVALRDPGYDALSVPPATLRACAEGILRELGLLQRFPVNVPRMRAFFHKVEAAYHADNPFHNFPHGFDIMRVTYSMLVLCPRVWEAYLTDTDILAILLGALCHDLDHPGVNNAYLVNSRSPLAVRYNDTSVLESHHASTAFKLMLSPDANFLSDLDPKVFREVRKVMVCGILSTDMAKHFEVLGKFNSRREAGDLSREEQSDRQLLVNVLLHACDVSNPTKPFMLSQRNVRHLSAEFARQVELERKGGLPVAPFMVPSPLPRVTAERELGFIDYIVSPLFSAVAELLPQATQFTDAIAANREQWAAIKAQGAADEAAAAAADAAAADDTRAAEQTGDSEAVKGGATAADGADSTTSHK